jgi:anti-sigma factor RsiW
MSVTPEQTATSSKTAVRYLGSAFTEDPRTLRRARELGLTGWAFFVAGLGSALGDVPADVVAAAVGFIAPEAVREAWDSARRIRPITEISPVGP